jgi:stringent starvation protein B
MSVDHDSQGTSTRPYLIRALHDWCIDNGFTPLLAVHVDSSVRVPMEFVKNNEIVLNVSFDATSGLRLGNDVIDFKARFGGKPRDILVPVRRVIAIYARENGQGMAFPLDDDVEVQPSDSPLSPTEAAVVSEPEARGTVQLQSVDGKSGRADKARDKDGPRPPQPPAGGGRPSLKRVK